jgi:hypothetical protein
MELIGALSAAIFGGGTAAAAGTTAAAGATAGSTALTVLQGAGTVFSALATIGSGAMANAAGQAEQMQQNFEAKEEYIQGKETSAALKQELAATVSNQAVAFAAGGVDLGSVSVQAAKRQAVDDAEDQLGIASNQALSRSLARRRAGRVAAARGKAAMTGSLFEAGTQIAKFGMDVYERG